MSYEIEHVDSRFEDEEDAVIVRQGGSPDPSREYRFIKEDKTTWRYVEYASERYDYPSHAEPSESDLQAILKKEWHLERIYAADGERVLAELAFDVQEETPYKNSL